MGRPRKSYVQDESEEEKSVNKQFANAQTEEEQLELLAKLDKRNNKYDLLIKRILTTFTYNLDELENLAVFSLRRLLFTGNVNAIKAFFEVRHLIGKKGTDANLTNLRQLAKEILELSEAKEEPVVAEQPISAEHILEKEPDADKQSG